MKHFLFLCVLFFVVTGCKKPSDDPEIIYLDASFYQYVLAPKGSWWVYEEETSGAKDTLTVVNKVQSVPDYGESGNFYEEATLFVKSSYSGYTVQYSSRAYDYGKSDGLYGAGNYHFFTSGMIDGESRGSLMGVRYTYLEYESLNINETDYRDVVKIENQDNRNPTDVCNEDFVSAKNIGIIQHKTCEGLTWNLIDYHINF